MAFPNSFSISAQTFDISEDVLSVASSSSSAPSSPSSSLNCLRRSITVLNEGNVVSQVSPMLSFSPSPPPPSDSEDEPSAVIEREDVFPSKLNIDLTTLVPPVLTAFSDSSSELTSPVVSSSSSVRSSNSSPSHTRERATLKKQSNEKQKTKLRAKQEDTRRARQKMQRCAAQLKKKVQDAKPKVKGNKPTVIIKSEETVVQSESTVALNALARPMGVTSVASPKPPAVLPSSASLSSSSTLKRENKEKTVDMINQNNASAKRYRKRLKELQASERRVEELEEQNKALRILNEVLLRENTTLKARVDHCMTAAFVAFMGI